MDSCDYPDFGAAAARAVAEGRCDRGIVICTTGIGISIAANKIKGFTGKNMAERMVEAFLSTEFEGGRHLRRVDKVMALEEG